MEWIGRSLSLLMEQMEEGSFDVGNSYKTPELGKNNLLFNANDKQHQTRQIRTSQFNQIDGSQWEAIVLHFGVNLKNLKQVGSVRDYMNALCSLMFYVSNMSKEDKIFNFLKNLQPWVQSELKRQDVKYFNFVIATAERLTDYQATIISSGKKTQGRGA